jgi:hypothetical protein
MIPRAISNPAKVTRFVGILTLEKFYAMAKGIGKRLALEMIRAKTVHLIPLPMPLPHAANGMS